MADKPMTMRHRLMRVIDKMRDEHESGCIVDALLDVLEVPDYEMEAAARFRREGGSFVQDVESRSDWRRRFTLAVKAIREGA